MSFALPAGLFDRKLQFRRAALVDDGFSSVETWSNLGAAVWASKADISDGERWRAGAVAASVSARFRVRWSNLSSGITPADRLVCDGREYDIANIKELGRKVGFEITASARAD